MMLMLLEVMDALAKLQKATISFVMSLRPSVCPSVWNNWAPTGRIFMKFCILIYISLNLSRKFKLDQNRTRITGPLREALCTLMITARSILLRMKNISDKIGTERQNTHFMFNTFFPAIYEIMSKNTVQPDRPQTTK